MDTNTLNALRKRAKAQSAYNEQLEQIEAQFPDWQDPIENILNAADHYFDEVDSVLLEGENLVVTVRCSAGWKDENTYLVVLKLNGDGTLKAMYDSRD